MSAIDTAVEGAAIRLLGPLFKLTEVYLWDDAVVDFPEAFGRREGSMDEPSSSCTTADTMLSLKQRTYVPDIKSVEDMELAREMDALGLPISFTAKEMNGAKTQKKNRARRESSYAGTDTENRTSGIFDIIEQEDVTSYNVFHDRTHTLSSWRPGKDQSAASHWVPQEKPNKGDMHSDAESVSLVTAVPSATCEERHCDTITDLTSCLSTEKIPGESDLVSNAQISRELITMDAETSTKDLEDVSSGIGQEVHSFNRHKDGKYSEGSLISCHITETKNDGSDMTTLEPALTYESSTLMNNHTHEYLDDSVACQFGDWRVFWDAFYSRNYFFNCQTQESTWYPPQGLEHFALVCRINEAGDNLGSAVACDASANQGAHISLDGADICWDNENNVEDMKQSSEHISDTMDGATSISTFRVNKHTGNVPAEQLYEHYGDINILQEQALPLLSDAKIFNADELNSQVKQMESFIHAETRSPLDISPDDPVSDSTDGDLPEIHMADLVDELESDHGIATFKKKKKLRRVPSYKKMISAIGCEPMSEGVCGGATLNILKYWYQRYLLFSRFDDGIKMDEEGWFSVTPETIARHHASRCGSSTIIDCFTGVGGNAIQFAMRSNHVIAIDIDPQKIDYALQNAAIYGVNDRIDFLQGDFFQMAPCLKGNIVFMSPPWGGPDYSKVETFDISMLKPHDGDHLFRTGRAIASRVVMFLPRNIDINQLAELSLSVDPPWALEVEKNFLNGRLKAITAYFSNVNGD